jgi:aspartyl-tRNA(Asn)/glutamyl-tRNA(Gln) amidotransferase subunit A
VPAALNGVCGLRPTLGSISNVGAWPLSWSTESLGPMARTVKNVSRILRAVQAYDPNDPRAIEHEVPDSVDDLDGGIGGLKIGVPREFFFENLDEDVASRVDAGLNVLRDAGAEVRDIAVGGVERIVEAASVIIRAEALALHRKRLEATPDMFGIEVQRRLRLGEGLSGVDVAEAMQRMREWQVEVSRLFETVDVIVTPVTEIVAPKIEGAEMIAITARLTRLTWPWSLAGTPALSVPCGFSRDGLPIGMQIVGPRWQDYRVLRVGVAYQDVTDWHCRRPEQSGKSH